MSKIEKRPEKLTNTGDMYLVRISKQGGAGYLALVFS